MSIWKVVTTFALLDSLKIAKGHRSSYCTSMFLPRIINEKKTLSNNIFEGVTLALCCWVTEKYVNVS